MHRPETNFNLSPKQTSSAIATGTLSRVWLLSVLLALGTMASYWPALRNDFVNYDDDVYVTANVHVQKGLTSENIHWAFTQTVAANWHPMTVLSHMLDCQLFGLKPWGHHLTSVLLHAFNAALVFLLLQQMTGALGRSALVAALFALHPLHVESVAWVAERKDVLSTCFGLLALIFYVRYARRVSENKYRVAEPEDIPKSPPASTKDGLALFYSLALFFFTLGLMSKPMLVTWPFVLLLLDYWPLDRFKSSSPRSLVAEKIPFFALMVMACLVTFAVQKQTGALIAGENLTLGVRGGNALISYGRYLEKLFWPAELAIFYPRPAHWPLGPVLLAGGGMLGMSAFFFAKRKRYPFVLMGWLWYCGTLVPVIGLVQVGEQAMADRYTYIPSLGALILVVWGSCELMRRWRYHTVLLSGAGCLAIVLCLVFTRQQLGYWTDSEALFRHAIQVTENNYVAHNNLGNALGLKGQTDEAIGQFQEAIRLKPDFVYAHNNLGRTLGMNGRTSEAIGQFQEAIRLKPDYADAHSNLGVAFYAAGRTDEAIGQFQEVIRLVPDDAEAHNNLGIAIVGQGRINEAIGQFQEAIRLKPEYADAHDNLARALEMKHAPAAR